jgi:hypothetical protein
MTETRKDIEARRVKRQLDQTAAERYADNQKDIAVLMDCIQMELETHAERAAEKPKDWGPTGDLTSLREELKNILTRFMIGRAGDTEVETARLIEDHLEEMRGE